MAQGVMRGDKPAIQIVGDVQLASEVNWLIENVRWDVEEDLSRIVGDAPAHAMGQVARRMVAALREFVARRPGQGSSKGLST
jgi:ubiquinone biosynthesis protein UbiJ